MLWIGLAGGVQVQVDGARVDEGLLGGRQGRRLLARLAWEGRAVHRDELADGIWLESLPRTWERTLSGVITRLRIGLGEAGVRGDVITFVDGRYSLVGGDDVHVDVREAACDLVVAREAADRNDLRGARHGVERALKVLRLPLLPGEDAGWVDVARTRHGALLLDALDLSVDIGLRGGWLAAAEGAAREAVHCDPLREAGHQRLLRVLMAEGDHAAVLTAYAACRRVLAEELGASPSSETEGIYLEALGVDPDVDRVADVLPGPEPVLTRPPFPPTLVEHATTLIGRESELVWLWSLWRRARAQDPLTVALVGPPGSGKRSLTAVFAREVYTAGGAVVHVCMDGDAPLRPDRPATDSATGALAVVEQSTVADTVPRVPGAALVVVLSTDSANRAPFDAARVVGALDRESVRAVVDERLGREARDDELEEWCATTGGWPGALVGRLSELAEVRARTLRGEAARANASLTAVQAELADEILRHRPRPTVLSRPPAERAPYKGLLRFEPEDADLFFGREQLVADVLSRLSTDRLVVVLGASGSGKSSLVRAGVVAELRRGTLSGSAHWPVALLTPGRDPMASLTACMVSVTGAATPDASVEALIDELDRVSPSVVIVDQFEELFMPSTADRDRVAFVAALLRGIADGPCGHRVVVVVRSDFFDECSALPGLSDAIVGSPLVVPPPTEVDLRRIVSLPVRVAGGSLEPGLVDVVIADSRAAPGSLPLVSTAMLESWGHRADSVVSIASYRASGGVAGAIAGLAEGVWSGFEPAEQRMARSMFLRLSGAASDANNPVLRAELIPANDVTASQVLDRLVRRRLITVDEDTVRLAHETLLREWPRLQGWLADDRIVREGLHHLRRATSDWEGRGRDSADLYRGTRLAAAIDLAADVELSTAERSFIDASTDQQRAELRGLRQRSRRLRALSGVLVVLLAVAVVTGFVAIARQREASDQARLATAQRLAREAGSADGLDLRLLLAVEARRLDDSPEARGSLVSQLAQAGAVVAFLRGNSRSLSAVAVSADGTLLATGSADGNVSTWRLPGGDPVATEAVLPGLVTQLTFAAGGELLAAGADGEVARWTPGADAVRFAAHAGPTLAVTARRDGSLVTAGSDGLLRSFSLTTGDELWSTSVPAGGVAGSFDRNGTRYAQLGDGGELTMFDVDDDGAHVIEAAANPGSIGQVTALALSADGRTLALGDRFGGVHALEPDTGDTADLGALTAGEGSGAAGGIAQLVFTRSGELLASDGGAIGRFDISARRAAGQVQLVSGRVTDLAVDPTGTTAVAVTETGETVLLDLDRSSLSRALSNAGQPVTSLSVDADGTVVAGGDGQVAILDLATGERRRVLARTDHPVSVVATRDGLLATGGRGSFHNFNGPHGTYSATKLESPEPFIDQDWFYGVTAIAMRPDGDFALGDEHGQVWLVDATSVGTVHDLAPLPAAAAGLAFLPGGDELVGVSADGTIVRWDLDGGPTPEPIELRTPATAMAITPDGRTIAVATANGAVIVDLATGASRAPLTSPYGGVEAVSFGVDGTVLATGGSGGVLLWDVTSGRRLGDPLPAPGNTAITFDPSGRRLITGSDDGELVVWDIDPDRWVELACDVAGRTLSREEWRRYLVDRTYAPACA